MASGELDLSARPDEAAQEAWAALARKALGLGRDELLTSTTLDGLSLPLLGTRAEWPRRDASGVPGRAPYTRGVHAETNGRWDIRTLCAEPDAAKANAEILEDLAGGATSIWLLLNGARKAAAARDGVVIEQPNDLRRVLKDVPASVPIAFDAGRRAAWLGRMLPEAIPDLRGATIFLNLDSIAAAAVSDGMTGAEAGLVAQIAALSPASRTIGIDTRPYHDAGATPAQELGIAAAAGVAYLAPTIGVEGLDLASAMRQIAFILVTDADFLLSAAKLRAFRRIWARVLDAFGAPAAMHEVHIAAISSERMMTRRDPHTNILRTTAAAFAAAIGGANAITILPYTSRLGAPGSHARRLARNTQNILMEECGLGRVIDAAGGAFGIERLTEDLAQQGWAEFKAIEARHGIAPALTSGYIRDRIAQSWEVARARIAQRSRLITGITDFPLLGEPFVDGASLPWQPHEHASSSQRTIGTPLPSHHLDEEFEALRAASDTFFEASGERPKIYLLRIGTEAECAERVAFARALFESGGIEAVLGGLTETAVDAASAFLDSGVRIAALVSSDEQYARHALAFAHEAKQSGARYLYFVGPPGDLELPLSEAGIDAFVDAGIDAVEVLRRLHIVLGLAP